MHTDSNTSLRSPSLASAGYSLIQIAISIMIIGIIMTALMTAYAIQQKRDETANAALITQKASNEVRNFRKVTGRYPCPAPLDVTRDDATYGKESDCTDDTSIGEGAFDGGIYVSAGIRGNLIADFGVDTDSDGTNDTFFLDHDGDDSTAPRAITDPANQRLRVRIGMLPFRQMMGMTEDNAYDSHGSRLFYAVTEVLAVKAENDNFGAINIEDPDGNSMVNPPQSAHFIIFSAGENRIGGVNREGEITFPCTGGSEDTNNCNFMNGGETDNRFVVASKNANAGADEYDDNVQYFSPETIDLWRRVEDSPNNITEITGNNIGIGVDNPTAAVEIGDGTASNNSMAKVGTLTGAARDAILDAAKMSENPGAMRASEKVRTEKYCVDGDVKCLDPEAYADGMECPPSKPYATGIGSDKGGSERNIICTDKIYYGCPTGEILVGRLANGSPKCEKPAVGCENDVKTLCNKQVSTGAGVENAIIDLFPPGITGSYTEKYKCVKISATEGEWQLQSKGGQCDCTPGTVKTSKKSLDCTTGYEGTYDTYATTSCPSGNVSYTDDRAERCECVGYEGPVIRKCGGGFTGGGITDTVSYTCVNGVLTSGTVTHTENTCTCDRPATNTKTSSCSGGQTGTITQVGTLNPTTCTYSYGTPTSTCACTKTAYTGGLEACPAGYSGTGRKYEYTVNTSSCTHVKGSKVFDDCTCNTSEEETVDDGTFSCPNPAAEKVKKKRKILRKRTGPGCSMEDVGIADPGECEPKRFAWTAVNNQGRYGPETSRPEGSSCTFGQLGQVKTCHGPRTSSGYPYLDCECQVKD